MKADVPIPIVAPGSASLPGKLLAAARRRAGLTQADLAKRLAISQAAVAQLERADSNPRLATLDRALRAAGVELVITTRSRRSTVDDSLIRQQLELAPAARIHGLEAMYEQARKLTTAGETHRGELA
ncbi:MAG TPA: helix-turn-helix transcriptional regulator [Solirubrobacteraceae bacterium]|jgi:transcriptional regulator with XRE-family HTH domain|nr:helix-turn-helix transcriptional regulator [Solirubrobacteraceae bacterium]